MSNKFIRLTKTLPSLYKAEINVMIGGLLKAWGLSDDNIEIQIKNTKDQLFVKTAEGTNLNKLGSNVGVTRSAELGIDDSDFSKLIPVMSFFPKQVRKTIIALLDVFWGPGFTRANISSGNVEFFNFGPEVVVGGTSTFTKNSKVVKGLGTQYTLELQVGDYIKPNSFSGTTYSKISAILDDTTIELSLPWESDTSVNTLITTTPIRTLQYKVDNQEPKTIRFKPNAFEDISNVSVLELVNFINSQIEHKQNITASKFLDPILGNKLNIRTNTPGLQGSIQIVGGDANTPLRLNFLGEIITDTQCRVLEINPNEIVVQIPSSVPVLRRSLKGSAHPRETKTQIYSDNEIFDFTGLGASSTLEFEIDGSPYIVNFNHALNFEDPSKATSDEVARVINSELLFLEAFTKFHANYQAIGLRTTEGSSEYRVTGGTANSVLNFTTVLQQDPDLIDEDFPSAYIFDPVGQLFTVTGISSELSTQINEGSVTPTINLANAANFPNKPGKILVDFGRNNQEGPIEYSTRPNNSTLLIDASYIFQKDHSVGRKVNLISNTPSLPRVTGEDYAFYVVGTEEAREAAQELIKKLLAAGVVIRFIIAFPEFLFECTCLGCGPPDSADYSGSLTGSGPLIF